MLIRYLVYVLCFLISPYATWASLEPSDSQGKALREAIARDQAVLDEIRVRRERLALAIQDMQDGGARLNGLVYETIRHIPTDEVKRSQIEQLARTIFDGAWEKTGQKPMDVYKELMARLAEVGHYPSPRFYQCQHDNGRVVYLLGCQHEYPMLSLHPEAVKILMTLKSCWLEMTEDLQDLGQVIGKLKGSGLTSTTNDWLYSLYEPYQEAMKELLQSTKAMGIDLESAHPVLIIHAMEEWRSSPTNPILKDLMEMSIEEELQKNFQAKDKHIRSLENETTRAVDTDLVQSLWRMAKEEDIQTICYKIESLLDHDISENKNWRQMKEEHEAVRDSLRQLLYHHFDVDLKPFYEEQEMKNRNLRWQEILREALAKGEFDQPGVICVGDDHLYLPTGLLKFYASQGFKILRMDPMGVFSLPVRLEE